MTAKKSPRTPSLRFHKGSGQGFVEISGRRIYLDKYELPETRRKYHQLVAEWMTNGCQLPADPNAITISELAAMFWKHATQHYRRPDGSVTYEQENFRQALRPLRELYGHTKASEFGPLALKTVRQRMIEAGLCRTNVNKQIGRIKRLFRWATENELIAPSVYHSLTAVSGLKWGRTDARESEPVKPVPDSVFQATLKHMTPTLREMVELQRLTGMRPGEVCQMRGCDLDASGKVWVYRPASHKTQHHGKDRLIFIGPKGQDVLRPFLRRDLRAYLFSPAQSEAERRGRCRRVRVSFVCGRETSSSYLPLTGSVIAQPSVIFT